jgi:hypothetical protein
MSFPSGYPPDKAPLPRLTLTLRAILPKIERFLPDRSPMRNHTGIIL